MSKRIAVVGLGDIAQKAYLPVLAAHRDIDLVGIMGRHADKVQSIGEQYRISGRFTDLDRLLDEQPELVFIHTATESHYELVMRCLSRGIHVYVDKPLSYDISQSEEMAAEALRTGKLLAVGFNRRFAPMVERSRQWVEAAGGAETILVQKNRTKLQQRSAIESLYDDAIHSIDLALWLGTPGNLRMNGDSDAFASPGLDMELAAHTLRENKEGRLLSVFGMLRSPQPGRTSVFSMERRAGTDSERVELHGHGRTAIVQDLEQAVLTDPDSGGQTLNFGGWDSHLYRRGFIGIIQHVLQSIDDPSLCTIRADLVLPGHRLVEALINP
ncbi:Gfo/Idh/MocA family protein [Paenibacillus solisilvae]|uniref:Gfo/Idh/MocA family protein n=1 Tax=Paenibacillus solisilvae TaxID=2486751 RepID=A0ABW0W322_9BACL